MAASVMDHSLWLYYGGGQMTAMSGSSQIFPETVIESTILT